MTYATHLRMAGGRGLLKGLAALSALVIAGLALASSANAADTALAVTVNGTGQGTSGAPVPTIATLNTTIANDGASPTPIPVAQTATITQTFPAEFKNELASFGSCPQANFDAAGTPPGGAEDPTVSCPANSLVGNGSTRTVAQNMSGTFIGESERVVIVKNATTGGLSLWVAYKVGVTQFSKILPGTIGTNSSGQTTITWDPTPVEATVPLVVKIAEFNTAYNANQSTLVSPEPFSNTGCSSGTWAFSSAVTFVGGSPGGQTATANVDCKNLKPPVEGIASIAVGKATVSVQGKGEFTVACTIAGACKGTYAMRATWPKTDNKFVIAKGDYSAAAGQTAKVTFKLTAKGKKLLESKKNGTLKTGLKLTSTEGKPTSRKFTLKS